MISSREIALSCAHGWHRGGLSMRPLRIAMLSIHSSPLGELGTSDTGGMSVYVRELCWELGRAGHTVDIYTCADSRVPGSEMYLSDRVRLIHLRIGHGGHIAKGALFRHLPDVFRSIEAHMTDRQACYDLIHSHYWLSGWVGRYAQDSWFVPHVVMFHTTGMAKRIACGREREPYLRMIAEKRLASASDRVLATTEKERDLLMKYYGVPGEKIGVAPCGVNLERFMPIARGMARKELGLQNSRSVILYVGRFAPVKGLERLIAAAAHLRHCRGLSLVIVGGDNRHAPAELIRLVKRSGVGDMIRFEGRVEHEVLPLYYNAADVLVVPSYYESFGLAALESLACGTPVVATSVGAMETLIRDGESGLLVESPDPRSLAIAIERCLVTSSRGGMSRDEIRASVLRYGWSGIASAVVREYAAVLRSM